MAENIVKKHYEYTGKIQPKPGEIDNNGQILYPYLPGEELVEAVNLTIYLERPLLIRGEPGSGKTRSAQAVAYELGLPYEAWHIKSTSRARDGLYTYDAVARLRDAQLAATGHIKDEEVPRIKDPASYLTLRPLGRAFQNEQRTVLLIDEIDKADIDFPNDLLLELDEHRFKIEETEKEIKAKAMPIVFITSNDEKDLPDAFLRRCLFHFIEFPDRDHLINIINAHFPDSSELLVKEAITRFLELRNEMHKDKRDAGKKVSSSELIDWFRILKSNHHDEVFEKLRGRLPYPGVLLKSWDDHRRYLSRVS